MRLVKLKCEGCGAVLKVNEELKKVTCNYCGIEFFIDDEVKRVEITKNINHHNIYTDEARIKENERKIKEIEYKDKTAKRDIITSFTGLGISILLCILLFLPLSPNKNEIAMPMNSKKYKGENYEDIILEIKNLGFENIETVEKKDLINGWITKDGEIEKISIDGDSTFEEGDIFSKDAKVVITYHTFK